MKCKKINKQCGYNPSVLHYSRRKKEKRNKLTSDFQKSFQSGYRWTETVVDQHSVYHKTGRQQNKKIIKKMTERNTNHGCTERDRCVCFQSLSQRLVAGIQVIKQSDKKQVLQRLFF